MANYCDNGLYGGAGVYATASNVIITTGTSTDNIYWPNTWLGDPQAAPVVVSAPIKAFEPESVVEWLKRRVDEVSWKEAA